MRELLHSRIVRACDALLQVYRFNLPLRKAWLEQRFVNHIAGPGHAGRH